MNLRMRVSIVVAALAPLAALCVPVTVRAEEPPSLADARALYEAKCATCHPLDRSLVKQADYAGWNATIKKMIANGATLSQKEADLVIGYLSAKSLFETKCNVCHDLAKPLAAIKSPEQWRATVATMAAKKVGLLAEEEGLAISQYLALARPAK